MRLKKKCTCNPFIRKRDNPKRYQACRICDIMTCQCQRTWFSIITILNPDERDVIECFECWDVSRTTKKNMWVNQYPAYARKTVLRLDTIAGHVENAIMVFVSVYDEIVLYVKEKWVAWTKKKEEVG